MMSGVSTRSHFYSGMALALLILVILGFGSANVARGTSPLEMPALFHAHGITYVAWFLLLIMQTKLISNRNYDLHRKLGYGSIALYIAMMVTGILMAGGSYERGISPIPEISLANFMAFPLFDLVGLTFFYWYGVVKRGVPVVHKHAMLMASIAIMDPAIARIGIVVGFMPLAFLLHFGLVFAVMAYDKRAAGRIHPVTWMGLAYLPIRLGFILTVGASEGWASLMETMFG